MGHHRTGPHRVGCLRELDGVLYPDAYARQPERVPSIPLYVGAADNALCSMCLTRSSRSKSLGLPGTAWRRSTCLATCSASSAEGRESSCTRLDSRRPQPIPGGRFSNADGSGEGKEAYHGTLVGDMALFARKEGGGGFMLYDVSDPTSPTYVNDYASDGNGGYVFYDEGFVFVGESSIGRVYDARDPSQIELYGEVQLPGDFDTLTPYGNVMVGSVDEEAVDGVATAVFPWFETPDVAHPRSCGSAPSMARRVAPEARIGVGFNEFIEPSSVFPGPSSSPTARGNRSRVGVPDTRPSRHTAQPSHSSEARPIRYQSWPTAFVTSTVTLCRRPFPPHSLSPVACSQQFAMRASTADSKVRGRQPVASISGPGSASSSSSAAAISAGSKSGIMRAACTNKAFGRGRTARLRPMVLAIQQ